LDPPGRPETAFGPIWNTAGSPSPCSVDGEADHLPRFGYLGKYLFEEGGRVGVVERGLEIFGAYIVPVFRALHSPNS
jgi:hypothetical protein